MSISNGKTLSPSGARVVLSPSATADLLGISRSGLSRLRVAGDFPHPIRLTPRRIGFRVEEINAWLGRRESGAMLEGGAR